jgi:WD40 repeat protein
VVALAVSPDGRMVATGGHDRAAIIWEADSYSKIRTSISQATNETDLND